MTETERTPTSEDADLVSVGYWSDLRHVVAQWATLPEFDDDDSSPEPMI